MLCLDEATANLDSGMEGHLLAVMHRYVQGELDLGSSSSCMANESRGKADSQTMASMVDTVSSPGRQGSSRVTPVRWAGLAVEGRAHVENG